MHRCSRAVLALAAAWACGGDSAGPSVDPPVIPPGEPVPATLFAFPLIGTLNSTFFYVNYVDRAQDETIRDYHCGLKTYDGHSGTDITLPSFAVMDSGVTVTAAAAGTVAAVHDGEFDRHRVWVNGAQWNSVAIDHGAGLHTIYGHLKANSITVTPGQMVQEGTPLGLVGSSGRSDMPHLHFEVRVGSRVVDPWAGPCGATHSHWAAQHEYQDAFSVIASGLTDAALTLDLVKDPPAQVATFTTADARVTMWVHLANLPAGLAEFVLYRPDGTEFVRVPIVHSRFYSMSWWWAWVSIPGQLTEPGTWRMEYRLGGVSRAERSFELVASPIAAPAVPLELRAGTGGGGLRTRGP